MVDQRSIVIQTGFDRCKAGFSGDNFPNIDFPTVVGTRKDKNIPDFESYTFVGDKAYKTNNLDLNYPIDENGVICDMEMMVQIWHHCLYDELKTVQSDHPCLITEAYFNPKLIKEAIIKQMFETFYVPAFYLQNSAVLSLLASGRSTDNNRNFLKLCVVVDCGEGVPHIVPIFELSTLHPTISKSHITGRGITDYCRDKMHEAGYRLFYNRERFREIKERYCYIALDYDSEVQSSQNRQYQLPDETFVTLKEQRFGIPEILFNPQLSGRNDISLGLSELTFQSIMNCDVDLRRNLINNIVLSGGTTMFSGFRERLSKDITSLAPSNYNVQVIAPPERQHSAFLGGSILSSLSSFQPYWISKAEYDEEGPRVIHRKQITCIERE